ncbi:MAG TPA: double-strand break repair protein AddB [Hyphomicrobium sp.]|nr:double-strand break repair protein AddB [Hyphomicrobium sp.]
MRTWLDQALGRTGAKASDSARVFTVPPGQPFLASVARAILSGNLPAAGGGALSALDLPGFTLLLPTRRAARAMQEAFLAASGGRAMLLPRIRPIAEGEEELTLLSGLAAEAALEPQDFELPPAVGEIERRIALTMLVSKWSQSQRPADAHPAGDMAAFAGAAGDTPAKAANLAADLCRLMDMVETEGVDFSGLAELVPEEFSEHWQQTIEFLKIITEAWPAHLAERGLLSPVGRRNRAILAEAERLTEAPPKGPVIVAGVTGSIPATVELMRVVARVANGAIVLPGLDPYLDEESWQKIVPDHPEHPQFGLKKLLDNLDLERRDVATLPGDKASASIFGRAELMAEAMRPSGTTAKWYDYVQHADRKRLRAALEGISLIEAPSAQDEAEVVALILREAAETPGRTAALISPDRLLARRVAIRLEAWGIRVDDSAGRPFAKTVPGTFLDLTIAAITQGFAPADVMALLKHPLARLGLGPFEVRRAARALEIAVFRDVYLGEGLGGIKTALARAEEDVATGLRRQAAVRRLRPDDWKGAQDLITRLETAFAPLVAVFASGKPVALGAIAAAHVKTAEALTRLPEGEADEEGSPLWREEAGTAAAAFFTGLADPGLPVLKVPAADYADLYRSLIAKENVRPRIAVHPRLFIWGPFEARLQQTDVVVLGGLNDGTWPEAGEPGPWLNRPMREALGLPSPEEKIGYAAHDFTSFLGAERVYLTRAQKIDGVPTVPSRWLMRLQALLSGLGLSDQLRPQQSWLGWARARDRIDARVRLSAPEPRPPVELRPRKLSVTRIETWLSNPYAIFADSILRLEKLPPLGADPDAALKGSIVHEIMSRFANAHPSALPDNTAANLAAIARDVLGHYGDNPRVAAFWLPRFLRFAHWFAETEPERRRGIARVAAEVDGKLALAGPGGPFTLTTRADRIDVGDNGIVITDYKTGTPPTDARIKQGLAPQLPLEAAIARGEAGFTGIAECRIAALRYIKASGGEPAGEERTVEVDDIAALADAALERLAALVAQFDNEATPYKALRRSSFAQLYKYDDYAHLARVAEWAAAEEEEMLP